MRDSNDLESIKEKWQSILIELSKVSRVAWLAFLDSVPISIEKNILIVGLKDDSKILLASENKLKENLQKVISLDTSFNYLIEIKKIDAKTIINSETEQNKNMSNTPNVNSTQYEVQQNFKSQNSLTKRFFGKRWQKIMWGIIIFYFLIVFLDSRFEFIPESSPGPQKLKEYECQTYVNSLGEYVDPCGDNYVPEENPGYQGR